MNKKIKIYVSYHRKFPVFKNRIFFPLALNEDVRGEDNGLTSTSTGVHIADLNKYFCEMTAIYWVWKNDIQDADFVGFCHYRRFFYYKDRKPFVLHKLKFLMVRMFSKLRSLPTFILDHPTFGFVTEWDAVENTLESATRKIERTLQNMDAIVRTKIVLANITAEEYRLENPNYTIPLEILHQLLADEFPEFYQKYLVFASGNITYQGNMFVFRKEIFVDYCETIFLILFRHLELYAAAYPDMKGYDRMSGYIAELLTSAYILDLYASGKNIKELRCYHIKDGIG